MIRAFKLNWKLYLIEAWALGMFMISAILFTMLFEHPSFYFKTAISLYGLDDYWFAYLSFSVWSVCWFIGTS